MGGGGGGGSDCHCPEGQVNINPFGCNCVGPGKLGGSGSGNILNPNVNDLINGVKAIPGIGANVAFGQSVLNGKDPGQATIDNLTGKTGFDTIAGPKPTPPDAPGQDPALSAIKGQQVQDAQHFRQNLPGIQKNLYEGAYNSERQNLGRNIQGVRNNANQRGLLYSGIEQGSELGQRQNSAQNLAQAKTEINNSTEDQENALDANAVQSGIMQQQSLASIQDQTMSQALQNMAARRATYSGIGQGVGAAAGTYLANQNAPRPSASSTSYGVGQPTYYGT